MGGGGGVGRAGGGVGKGVGAIIFVCDALYQPSINLIHLALSFPENIP